MAEKSNSEPWWFKALIKLVPDVRAVVMFGYFCLAARLLYMIEGAPDLLKDSAFIGIATMVMGSGGLGIITSFLFGGTKAGSEVMVAQSKIPQLALPAPVQLATAPPVPAEAPAKVDFMKEPVP